MDLHTLPKLSGKKKKRLGRGNASGKGNYSGRGMKGQRSRSGGKGGLKLRGLKQTFKSIPKVRGFNSPYGAAQPVNLSALNDAFADGDTVNAESMKEKGLVTNAQKSIKILGNGELSKKLTVSATGASKSAREAIEKAGGTFTEISTASTIPERGTGKKATAKQKKKSGNSEDTPAAK